MRFRCPYCKREYSDAPPATCVQCHHTMIVPEGLRPDAAARRMRRRRRRLELEEAEIRTAAAATSPYARRNAALILVLGVLIVAGGLLVGRTGARFPSPVARPKVATAAQDLRVLRMALDNFYADCGHYPQPREGLLALINRTGDKDWDGPYVNLIRRDPWHQPYAYASDGSNVTLFSCGPDTKPGTRDDLHPVLGDAASASATNTPSADNPQ